MDDHISTQNFSVERVLIQAPVNQFWYINHGMSLRHAFIQQGLDCHLMIEDGMCGSEYLALLGIFKPQLVISINSPRLGFLDQFKDILHVRWIQDSQFRGVDYRQSCDEPLSDFCYLATSRLQAILPVKARYGVDVLRLATQPTRLPYSTSHESVFSLVGYIPHKNLIDQVFADGPNGQLDGWSYFAFLEEWQQVSLDTNLECLDELASSYLRHVGLSVTQVPTALLSLLREEYIRAYNRFRLMRHILAMGEGCRIYGMNEWCSWPEFAPYFCGPLVRQDQLEGVFRSSVFNLHNGGTLSHPRAFDCLGAHGGVLLANQTVIEPDLGFEPGVHFVEYNLDTLNAVIQELADNEEKRQRISDNAYQLVLAKHTWAHRAKKILADIAR